MNALNELQHLLDESGDPDNPGPEELKTLMERVRTIAVVGISRNPEKPARRVPAYLAAKGYEIIPVNPFVEEIFGKPALGFPGRDHRTHRHGSRIPPFRRSRDRSRGGHETPRTTGHLAPKGDPSG